MGRKTRFHEFFVVDSGMSRALLLLALVVSLGACAETGNRSAGRTLRVGDQLLFAPNGFARTTQWRSSQPSIVQVKVLPDERGVPQVFLIAKRPGRALIEPLGSVRAGIVGPPEMILNQSSFNNRMAGPPAGTRQRFMITVE